MLNKIDEEDDLQRVDTKENNHSKKSDEEDEMKKSDSY